MSRPCEHCRRAERDGYLPFSHCDECHLSWAGHAECHCTECHRHFSGDSAFMAHQADGTCRDPSSLHDGNERPRFKPVVKVSSLGSRTVWVRNLDMPGGAFGGDSASAKKRAGRTAKTKVPAA